MTAINNMENPGIRIKLFATTLSVLLMTVISTSALNILQFRSLYVETVIERARACAQNLRDDLNQGLEYIPLESFSDMTTLLNTHLRNYFSYSFVADSHNKILYHSDGKTRDLKIDPIIAKKLVFSKDVKSVLLSAGEYYEVVIPVIFNFDVIGTVHVGVEKKIVENKIIGMIVQNAAVLLLSIMLLVVLLKRHSCRS